MANNNELKRIYLLTDGELKQFADQVVIFVTRDMTDFTPRGISAATLTALNLLITAFDNYPSDPELQGLVMQATEAKYASADQLKSAIRNIRNMAEITYKNGAKYQTFDFKDMARLSDDDLMRLARRVVRVGTTLLTELAAQGLTTSLLTALTNLANTFDSAINTQFNAIENRDLATQERITKGNTLYAEVSRLCSIGQTIYFEVNPAKYNDYVIYGSSGTTYILNFTVSDHNSHTPLANVDIHIHQPDIHLVTNELGIAHQQTLADGEYNFTCTKPEYQNVDSQFTISGQQTTHVTVEMTHS